ncbi:hypothetical protein PO909_027964 [Leuciscus waleckii]
MVGDSLTLNTDFTETKGDELHWKIEGESDVIAQIDREANKITVPGNNEERFRDRLKLDHQTGSLTITNIRTTDSGVYELKIKDSMNDNKYVFFVDTDGVKSVSVTEGDTVTLHTGVTDIHPVDSRWKNIDLNDQTRDLTISNIQRDQTGNYKLEINSNSMIVQRKFYLAVGEMTPVSVKKGEYILLDTGLIEIKGYDLIMWKFEDHLIAEINKGTNGFVKHDTRAGGRFKGRLKMHSQIVSLVIGDSKTTDSGDYSVHMISSSHTIQRTISVTVSGE